MNTRLLDENSGEIAVKLSTSCTTVLGGKLRGLICNRWSELHPMTCREGIDRDGWSTPRTRPQYAGKDPVPIVQEAVWAPGSVWTVTGNVDPTGMRSPFTPARSMSLYRAHHLGPIQDAEMLHGIFTKLETQDFCSVMLCVCGLRGTDFSEYRTDFYLLGKT